MAGHDWAALKAARDAYVVRLNGIYERNLAKRGVTLLRGWATLVGADAPWSVNERRCCVRERIAAGYRRPAARVRRFRARSWASTPMASSTWPSGRERGAVVGGGYIWRRARRRVRGAGQRGDDGGALDRLLREFDPLLVDAADEGLHDDGRAADRDMRRRLQLRSAARRRIDAACWTMAGCSRALDA